MGLWPTSRLIFGAKAPISFGSFIRRLKPTARQGKLPYLFLPAGAGKTTPAQAPINPGARGSRRLPQTARRQWFGIFKLIGSRWARPDSEQRKEFFHLPSDTYLPKVRGRYTAIPSYRYTVTYLPKVRGKWRSSCKKHKRKGQSPSQAKQVSAGQFNSIRFADKCLNLHSRIV